MADATTIGVLAAFGAGVISFLSPCVLPLVPAYVSYVAGESVQRGRALAPRQRLRSLGMSAPFVAGFSVVFISFGASASALGLLLRSYRYEANLVAGTVVIAFGLFMLGLWRFVPWLQRDLRLQLGLAGGNPYGSFMLGVAFAFGWTPCIGPILGAILAMTALDSTAGGIGLLSAYSLGLGVPFLLTALFVDRAANVFVRLRGAGAALQLVGGAVLVALGVAMMTDQLTVFSTWLLDAFPILGTIG
jgi:cytochrome c-type biogenesis protein